MVRVRPMACSPPGAESFPPLRRAARPGVGRGSAPDRRRFRTRKGARGPGRGAPPPRPYVDGAAARSHEGCEAASHRLEEAAGGEEPGAAIGMLEAAVER